MAKKLLEITYARSSIGRSSRQRKTVEALGLKKLHDSVRHEDTPTIRGMVAKVQHLLSWRELEEGADQ